MIKKDFKQKYFLYCRDCTEPLIRKVEEQISREKKIKTEEI